MNDFEKKLEEMEIYLKGDKFISDEVALIFFRQVASRYKNRTEALTKLLDKYVRLVKSGDCGQWDPEDVDEVKFAREVLDETEERKDDTERTSRKSAHDTRRIG